MEEHSERSANAWSIPREEARLLHLLLLAQKPKTILEIGTSTGYSTVWFALAARECGGKVFTIEYDPKKVEIARKNFTDAGVAKTITILEGDANKILTKWKKPIDFAFLDGVKAEYLRHFKWIFPHMGSGGIIAADNAGDFSEEMKGYLKHVRGNADLFSTFVPIGNGVELTSIR